MENRGKKIVRVKRKKDDLLVASACAVADSMFSRLLGLLPRANLSEQEALWIRPCNSVHTFFMRFSIDVLFLNKENEILHIVSALKPWRATKIFFSAASVMELPAGWSERIGLKKGDVLSVCDTPCA